MKIEYSISKEETKLEMNAGVEFIFGYKRIDQQYGLVAPNIPNGLVMSLDLYNGIEEIKNIIFDEVKKILPQYKQTSELKNQEQIEQDELENNDILRVIFENRSVNKQESQFDGFKWLSVELEDEIKQELQEYLNHQLSEDVSTKKDNNIDIIKKAELSSSLSLSVNNHEDIFAEKQPVEQEQIVVDIEPLKFNFDSIENIEQGFASGQDLTMILSSHQDNIQLKKENCNVENTHDKSDIDSNMIKINGNKDNDSLGHQPSQKVINYLTGNYNNSIKTSIKNESKTQHNKNLTHKESETASNFEFQFLHNKKGVDPRKFADDLVEHFLSHNHH